MDNNSADLITVDLDAGMEWRFELEEGEAIAVRVTSPDPVYINYQELPPNTWYPLYGELKAAIWSPLPSGRLEVSSSPSTSYTSLSSTFPFILNLHLVLEKQRIIAKRNIKLNSTTPTPDANENEYDRGQPRYEEKGPRVMVLGPANSGKSTMVKGLLNLATGSGMGWAPGVIGLDPANSAHLLPGSVTLSTPTQPVPTHHPSHPLGSPPSTSAAMTLASDVPTVGWFVGSSELSTTGIQKMSFPRWRKVVEGMAERWRGRCEADAIVRASGLLVDTPTALTQATLGAAKGDRTKYGLVIELTKAFEIDIVVVIGHEKLTIEMQKLLSPLGTTVISGPKSSGVVELDDVYHSRIKAQQIKTYFYGEPSIPQSLRDLPGRMVALESSLHPYSFTIPWDELEIYRVGEEAAAPSSALPIGKQRTISSTRLTRVNPASSPSIHRLGNAVLGLIMVTEADKRTDLPPKKEKTGAVVAVKVEEVKTEEEIKREKDEADGIVKIEGGEVPASVEGAEVKEEDGLAAPMGVDDEDEEDEPIWKEEIGWREACGFLVITKIDTAKRKYELLTPSPGKLPSRVAIVGSVEWIEEDS